MELGAKELRARLAEVLRAVRGGEKVTITYRGRPVAQIKPVDAAGDLQAPEAAVIDDVFGMWADHEDMEDASAWVRERRHQRVSRSSSTPTS